MFDWETLDFSQPRRCVECEEEALDLTGKWEGKATNINCNVVGAQPPAFYLCGSNFTQTVYFPSTLVISEVPKFSRMLECIYR